MCVQTLSWLLSFRHRTCDTRICLYSASALLAMQTAVVATANLSVRLSVCLSVTFWCFVQTNKDKRSCGFSIRYGTIILVFTALHGMQTRSYDEISVRPSVKRVHCDKTGKRYV